MRQNIIYLTLALLFTLMSCGDKKPSQQEEQQDQNTMSEANIKEVELNQAQFNAAGIELGDLEQKNLTDNIRVNGTTQLPAQSQADVSSILGGTITEIRVNLGDPIEKGQVLALVESPDFIQLQEAYLIAKNNLEYLELEFDRQQTLREQNVNSQKTFQKIKSDLNIEKARYQSLTNQLKLVNQQGGTTKGAMVITAPISGNVATIEVKMGTTITPGQSIFTLVDNSNIHLDLQVFEKDLPFIKEGQKVDLTLTNVEKSQITATIFSISKAFNANSKTVTVHAKIDTPTANLIPGMYVNALINIGKNTVEALPLEAIVKADGRQYIFVLHQIEQQGESEQHYLFNRLEVKTGVSELGYTQIELLQPRLSTEPIALQGAYYIQSHLTKNESGGGHAH